MSLLRSLKYWIWSNRLSKTGMLRLQHEQADEHRQIVKEVKKSRRNLLHEMSDVIIRLESVSDNLEKALKEMRDDGDETVGR